MDILKAFPLLMQQEGISLTNIAGDKGGLTKFGIAKASHPNVDIASLTEQQAIDIYLNDYWVPGKISSLPIQLQYAHFSCGVNCGIGSAAKILQRSCRIEDDGIIGPGTLAACEKISIYDYCIEWNNHYKAIVEKDETQAKFMVGWQNRINKILDWWKAGQLN